MEQSEELALSHKTWKRCADPIEKDGFREGFEKGREKSYQEGFNIGFKSGFTYGYERATTCGKSRLADDSYKERLEGINGECIMCKESEEHFQDMDLDEIQENQKKVYKELR